MNKKQKIEWAQAQAKKNDAMFVNAIFTSLGEIPAVRVRIPGINDTYFKQLQPHKIMVPTDATLTSFNIIAIGAECIAGENHQLTFRRGDWIEKQMLTRQFCILPESIGTEVVADVEIMEKTDLFRNGKKSITLIIRQLIPNGHPVIPQHRIKIAVNPTGDKNEFMIPETGKVVRFESTQRN